MESLTGRRHRTSEAAPQRARLSGVLQSPSLRATAMFAVAWSLLDVCSNLRFPGGETRWTFLLPSLDVAVVLSIIAVSAWRGVRVSPAARFALLGFFLVTRALRIGDGFQDRYFHRTFNLYFDLRLVPELVRLFFDTAPLGKFLLGAALVAGALAAIAGLLYWALTYVERYLKQASHRRLFAIALGALVVASPFVPDTKHYPLWGAFAPSIVARFVEEGDFLLHVYEYRKEKLRAIEDTQQRLGATPHDLAELNGKNVYLFVVESYGQTVLGNPRFFARVKSSYESFETALKAGAMSSASAFLTSPTYGGSSWLAHATLATGVRTADQFHYGLLLAKQPKPIARFFKDAGYRTVSVLPGTRRKWREGDVYQFDQKYYWADFDYSGPELGWGKLPDQYVVDFVRRREIERPHGALFVEYALVSSHAPWNVIPPVVTDWNAIGRGDVYRRMEPLKFDTSYEDLGSAADAYLASIAYDLGVLRDYVIRYVEGDSLVVIVGDHQPVPDVTGEGQPWSVPIHVISRRSSFVERFVARGYTRGMIPRTPPPHPGLETFLPRFLEDFSSPRKRGGKS